MIISSDIDRVSGTSGVLSERAEKATESFFFCTYTTFPFSLCQCIHIHVLIFATIPSTRIYHVYLNARLCYTIYTRNEVILKDAITDYYGRFSHQI